MSIEPSDAQTVQRYLKDLQKYPPLSREEEQKTLKQARKGNRKAMDRIITSNLRFVVAVASEYQGQGLPFSELIAEGNTGLLEAFERFDEKRGYKFISYAVWWIRQAIHKALKKTTVVSRPVNQQEDMNRIARHWRQMTQTLGRTPTLEEVFGDMKIPRERAERALQSVFSSLSLESPIYEESPDNTQTLLDILWARGPAPDQQVLEGDVRTRLEEAMNQCLNTREVKVVWACFGLDGGEQHSLESIGSELNITRERVRQIRNRALQKLQRVFESRIFGMSLTCQDLV